MCVLYVESCSVSLAKFIEVNKLTNSIKYTTLTALRLKYGDVFTEKMWNSISTLSYFYYILCFEISVLGWARIWP